MRKTALMTLLTVAITVMGVFTSYASNVEDEVKNRIESLDKSDLQSWFIQYKEIQTEYSDRLDPDETIHDVITEEEFNYLCSVTEAEISNGNFEQKINIASAIINRYRSPKFPDTFTKVLNQKIGGYYQFTPVATGAWKKYKVTDSTRLAVEYAFQIEDTAQGCTYYCSNKSNFHETKLQRVFFDGKHYFYTEK